ncbi:hypothetical protein ncot_10545 [Nocardioides sp. JQ2195]|uniref:hypothetical protein n=1 Tax=Nocardioides sp. JQ2195 TaxID=2592334 RepID=UPI00143EC5F1|nr:hypothetical protein [Nocardioides sp. JQ2195]QIX26982.1 hypothetical protein ncot_10545 [Nocardioides sp. JQ2195]
MSERAQPQLCPYCGDDDLRPHDGTPGSWECRSCLRAFTLKMTGMIRPTAGGGS